MISIYHCLFESLLQFRTTDNILDFRLFLTLTVNEMSGAGGMVFMWETEKI